VTLTWILVYKEYEDATKAHEIRDLFRWCLLEGQASASKFGYLPLTESVVSDAVAAVDSVKP
jgi:ABC-type phosphate transport system substrate-binding protein